MNIILFFRILHVDFFAKKQDKQQPQQIKESKKD